MRSQINSIDRARAIFAFKKINDNSDDNTYLSHIKRAPMLILNNGFLPTVAFYKHKNKKIFEQITEWYIKQIDEECLGDEVVLNISELPQSKYRYWTKEILALLIWMKRFAEGVETETEINKEVDEDE